MDRYSILGSPAFQAAAIPTNRTVQRSTVPVGDATNVGSIPVTWERAKRRPPAFLNVCDLGFPNHLYQPAQN